MPFWGMTRFVKFDTAVKISGSFWEGNKIDFQQSIT
jgi:hypothetical protein